MKNLALLTAASATLFLTACGDKPAPVDVPEGAQESAAAAVESAGGAVPLTTEIPPELIEGTPQPIKVPEQDSAP